MSITNIEIKARASEEEQNKIIGILKQNNAKYLGADVQTDTYFKVDKNEQKTGNFLTNSSSGKSQIEGRFKLRRGDIENYLIYYEREDKKEAKLSNVILFDNQGRISELEKILKKTYEILIQVEKKRNIYFIENVKFHIDNVSGLGRFIEIEAISQDKLIPIEKLQKQCNYYIELLGIENKNLIKNSYSDMIMEKNKNDKK